MKANTKTRIIEIVLQEDSPLSCHDLCVHIEGIINKTVPRTVEFKRNIDKSWFGANGEIIRNKKSGVYNMPVRVKIGNATMSGLIDRLNDAVMNDKIVVRFQWRRRQNMLLGNKLHLGLICEISHPALAI